MNDFTILSDLHVQLLYPYFPATSHISGSLPRSIQLYSHNTLETRDAAPNTFYRLTRISQITVSPISPLYTQPPLKPNTSAQPIVPCVCDPLIYSVPVFLNVPSTLSGDIFVVGNTAQPHLSIFGTGTSDKIQDDTCIHKSYDLTFYIYSFRTSLSLVAPFREVQIIYFLQPCQRFNHTSGPLPKAVD